MKILVLKFRNIGDVLLTTPLLDALGAAYPDAKIDMALNAGTEAVIQGHPAIRHVHVYDRKAIRQGSFWNRIRQEAAFAERIRQEKYYTVIALTEGDRSAWLARYSGAKERVGIPSRKNRLQQKMFIKHMPSQEKRHTVEWNLDAARVLGIPVSQKRVSITWDESDEAGLPELPETFVHIHPLSRWQFKCIHNGTMARVIDYIQTDKQIPVVLTASDDSREKHKLAQILSHCQSAPLNLAGTLSLKRVAALTSKARAFIGVDTAIMHMAAAVDTPVMAFFGPSGAFHWGPWDNALMESGYTERHGNQRMGRHRVIQDSRGCVPCGKDGCEGSKESDCLMRLDFGMIRNEIDALLEDALHV